MPEDHNGLPLHDLLSPGEEQEAAATGTTKKARTFIATVVSFSRRVAIQ